MEAEEIIAGLEICPSVGEYCVATRDLALIHTTTPVPSPSWGLHQAEWPHEAALADFRLLARDPLAYRTATRAR